ncbi:hypothetical protein IX317_001118 [Fusobacterium sp. DD29]|uniref:hypothetical protein n=1 Tax=unclassified Fusobacterium TaxID=2648384 RepID=UPI001B8C0516|nr:MULTISPECIES: hypothetical protein [unclassified Fusobacterium]MBR8701316.1 hypothetical protein [Fusobacterium sp. DD45]MBR8711068.1 hypothetical protein [Fusobacterium sp. DD28]MBR8749444.1 hypothetical protein [Fusobacterium sp. DD29]MBR8751642.1 hypothetical protein [Fusobacterium sp. DD26]MBR8761666.1 hypothetical protein [Fusobacterium sp. DD25]
MDLNQLLNFKFQNDIHVQRLKMCEEWIELQLEIRNHNKRLTIEEGLDLITATLNYLQLLGISEEDFNKHINKLRLYRKTKYPPEEDVK